MQHARANASASGGIAGYAVARRHIGVGAVVDVKQRALRAFKQQVGAVGMRVIEFARHVGHHGLEQFGVAHGFVIHGVEVDGRRMEIAGQHEVVQIQQLAQLGGKALGVFQVLHAQRAAGNLVLVGRANAAARGANLGDAALFAEGLARHVQRHVKSQDQRTSFADAQARAHFDARFFQSFDFFQQLGRRQHDAVADVALHAGAHDAAGNQVQRGLHAVDDQRVTRIVAALKAHHTLRHFGQPVHQFALAFVAPLGAHDHDVTASSCDLFVCHLHFSLRIKWIKPARAWPGSRLFVPLCTRLNKCGAEPSTRPPRRPVRDRS